MVEREFTRRQALGGLGSLSIGAIAFPITDSEKSEIGNPRPVQELTEQRKGDIIRFIKHDLMSGNYVSVRKDRLLGESDFSEISEERQGDIMRQIRHDLEHQNLHVIRREKVIPT